MRKLGFTLAEVLITLVIIGVIAAMTVPTLMNNTNAQEFRSALKKAISGANQALTLNYALEGLGAQDYASATDIVEDLFKKRMSVIEDNTWAGEGEGACAGSVFTTADGMKFCVINWVVDTNQENSQTGACNSYNTVPCTTSEYNLVIDVNGAKKPNRLTTSANSPRDIYKATIYNQKVIPYGEAAQGVMFDKQVATGTGN
jgi:prepilin-type N-terminal cleavage/methylation domain-containing protein